MSHKLLGEEDTCQAAQAPASTLSHILPKKKVSRDNWIPITFVINILCLNAVFLCLIEPHCPAPERPPLEEKYFHEAHIRGILTAAEDLAGQVGLPPGHRLPTVTGGIVGAVSVYSF